MRHKTIGRKVRDLRLKLGLGVVDLAKKAKVSQGQVSRLENGQQGFRSATLLRFAKALGVPPIYFFTDQEHFPIGKVAEELETYGLSPTKRLRKALTDPLFLRFVEDAATLFEADKDTGRLEELKRDNKHKAPHRKARRSRKRRA